MSKNKTEFSPVVLDQFFRFMLLDSLRIGRDLSGGQWVSGDSLYRRMQAHKCGRDEKHLRQMLISFIDAGILVERTGRTAVEPELVKLAFKFSVWFEDVIDSAVQRQGV